MRVLLQRVSRAEVRVGRAVAGHHRARAARARRRRALGRRRDRRRRWPTRPSTCASSATRRAAPTARSSMSAGRCSWSASSRSTRTRARAAGRRSSTPRAPELADAPRRGLRRGGGGARHRRGARRVRRRDGGRAGQRRADDDLARQRHLSVAGSPLLVRLRNRAARMRQHRWRMAAYTSGGTPRRHGRRAAQRHDAPAPDPRPSSRDLLRPRDEALRAGRLQPRLAGRGLRHPARRARGLLRSSRRRGPSSTPSRLA